jgi:hypothetical protein
MDLQLWLAFPGKMEAQIFLVAWLRRATNCLHGGKVMKVISSKVNRQRGEFFETRLTAEDTGEFLRTIYSYYHVVKMLCTSVSGSLITIGKISHRIVSLKDCVEATKKKENFFHKCCCKQLKVKLSLCLIKTRLRRRMENRRIVPRILKFITRCKWLVCFTPRPHFTQEYSPRYLFHWSQCDWFRTLE